MTTTILWTATERCSCCGHDERLIVASEEGIRSRCYACGDERIKAATSPDDVELTGAVTRPRHVSDVRKSS